MQLCFYRCVFVTFSHLNTKHWKPSYHREAGKPNQSQIQSVPHVLLINSASYTLQRNVSRQHGRDINRSSEFSDTEKSVFDASKGKILN